MLEDIKIAILLITLKKTFYPGDTLFSCGCGRLFEGQNVDMHKAMQKIKKLPKETLIYCAHEYTLQHRICKVTRSK